jgi:hypothetical protein
MGSDDRRQSHSWRTDSQSKGKRAANPKKTGTPVSNLTAETEVWQYWSMDWPLKVTD